MTSWSLFLVYFENNPKILKVVTNHTFSKATIRFSPGVHQISPRFQRFCEIQYVTFCDFCVLCAFGVHTKKKTNVFT